MNNTRPYVLCISGFDPSGGAGILADAKTLESIKAYALGVCSAITFQNDTEFDSVSWIQISDILRQIEVLSRKFTFSVVKIGIMESFDNLEIIVNFLRKINPAVKIVWDTVLKASAGFVFHKDIDFERFHNILKHLFLVTPNIDEAAVLFPQSDYLQQSTQCAILLKGGHCISETINDKLFYRNEIYLFEGVKFNGFSKHGTGCILSSAIAGYLALGMNVTEACKAGKKIVEKAILSNNINVAYF